MNGMRRFRLAYAAAAALLGVAMTSVGANAEKKYGPGVTDTEIKIGNTMSYSGAAASYGSFGRVAAAYFEMLNKEEGGINGRKINFITVDDGFSPPKTVEMTRKLVESDGVLFMAMGIGTGPQAAVQKYLNDNEVPQIFVLSGATRFANGEKYPWTTGLTPTYKDEGREAARYVLDNVDDPKIALLSQNDDSGQDTMDGFKEVLGPERAKQMIVAEMKYEATDATINSQIRQAKASGANVFFENTASKFTAQAIRIAYDIGWKPLHIVTTNSSSVAQVIEPAGFEKAQGLISGKFIKEPNDPQWADDPAIQKWKAWMAEYYPEGSTTDWWNVHAYNASVLLAELIRQCGDDLTRENVVKQALNLNVESDLLLPGLKMQTSEDNRSAISKMRYYKFVGEKWTLIED